MVVNNGQNVDSGETFWLDRVVVPKNVRIPNNIKDEVRLLSSIFAYNVGNSIELSNSDGKRFDGELDFSMTYNPENQMLGLAFNKGKNDIVSKKVIEAVKKACVDDDFQRYALFALRKKRRTLTGNPKLDLVLSFKNGVVDPSKTFVQS